MTLEELLTDTARTQRVGWDRHLVAVLRPAQHHSLKKTAHATEQDRPDVLALRWDWFESQLDLDPTG